jgi:hypothetical protein
MKIIGSRNAEKEFSVELALFKLVLRYILEVYYEPILRQKDAYFAEVDA